MLPSLRLRIWPYVLPLALGIACAALGAPAWAGWLSLGCGIGVLAASAWRAIPAPVVWFSACLACFGLGVLREDVIHNRVAEDSILRFVGPERRLFKVSGIVATEAHLSAPSSGEFAPFVHHDPVRHFQLQVSHVQTHTGIVPASGLLAVTQKAEDGPIHAGDRVAVLGWISKLRPPLNPGEFDKAAYWRRAGVAAFLDAGPVWRVQPAPVFSWTHWHAQAAARAQASLELGLHADRPWRTTLISALLLGAKGGQGAAELWQDFQRAGLAHVLAISGANVGVFLLGVWALGRFLGGRPGQVAAMVVAGVGLFLLSVPDDTPVLRAGLMVAALACAYGLGRPFSGLFALGLAAFVLLLWRPEELFSPGFQLSFAAVGALFLFVRPLTNRVEQALTGRLPIENQARHSWRTWVWRKGLRWMIEAAVSSGVVFLAVLPILMFHFDVLSPLAAFFSLAAAIPAAALMWVGYAKIVLGLIWEPLGAGLALPTEKCADVLAWVVHGAAHCPGAQLAWVRPTSLGLAGLAWAAIWGGLWLLGQAQEKEITGSLAGLRRKVALWPWLAWLLLAVALAGLVMEQVVAWRQVRLHPGLRLHEAAVGDGSCIVLETRESAVLFDCGSRSVTQPGARIAVAGLRRLGIRQLDALIVSHADLDHFGGMLEVADAFPVKAAYLGPSVWDDAARAPQGPSGVLLAGLRKRAIPCWPIVRGWRMDLGAQAQLQALWPAADFSPDHSDNNRAVVLQATCAAQRALLCADLEDEGMRGLFVCEPDLCAQVADLPHHGGFTKESPRWLEKVAPQEVIQSASLTRYESLMSRQWRPLLKQAGVKHHVTGRDGWITVELGADVLASCPKAQVRQDQGE